MIWLTPGGEYLVEGEPCDPTREGNAIRGPDGHPLRAAAYYLVTPAGAVSREFSAPIPYSIDYEWGLASIHAVLGDALHN
jgi:hypothetical protein